jgi:hypothetical protein
MQVFLPEGIVVGVAEGVAVGNIDGIAVMMMIKLFHIR